MSATQQRRHGFVTKLTLPSPAQSADMCYLPSLRFFRRPPPLAKSFHYPTQSSLGLSLQNSPCSSASRPRILAAINTPRATLRSRPATKEKPAAMGLGRRRNIPERRIEADWEREGSGITGNLMQAIERAKKIAENAGKQIKRNSDTREALSNMLSPRDVEQMKDEMSSWRMRYLIEGDKIDEAIARYTEKHGETLTLGFSSGKFDPLDNYEELGLALAGSVTAAPTKNQPPPLKAKAQNTPRVAEESENLHRSLADNRAEENKKRRRMQQALKKLVGTCGIIKSLIGKTGLTKKKALKSGLVEMASPTKPFQSEGASKFFNEVAQGNMMGIRMMLNKNKYLVYDFDYVGRTALHIAARRSNVEVIRELLDRLADPNASDISGRTPLYVAAKHASITAVKLLLVNKANPSFVTHGNLTPLDVAHTHLIKEVLQTAVKVYKQMALFISKENKEGTWRHVCTLNFMPSNNDQNDFELDAIPESLRKALDRKV